jgi:hypothetical protein
LEQLFGLILSLYRGKPNQDDWVVACLEGAWPRLLGDKLAAICRPASFKGSELVIEISDSEWEDAVKSVQPALLEKLRTATEGRITALSLRLGRRPSEN